MQALTRWIANAERERMLAQLAQYWRDRAEYGRSDYCQHGVYIGTWWGPDYMCGVCESRDESDEHLILAMARDYATTAIALMEERAEAVKALNTLGAPLTEEARKELGEWCWEAIAADVERVSARRLARTARMAGWKRMSSPDEW